MGPEGEEPLAGGIANLGKVVRFGDTEQPVTAPGSTLTLTNFRAALA